MKSSFNQKRVGLITMHRVINYGSFLQAYATQKIINNLGFNCEIIDYNFPNEWHFQNGLKRKLTLKTIISSLIYPLGLTKSHRKKKHIQNSISKYLSLTKYYKNPNELTDNPPKYDVYVTGSDQTWNPKHMKGDPIFMLSFAPQKSRKISFSASIAGKHLDDRFKPIFSKYLNQYDAISIRDENGNSVIKELTGKNASVVLDPTLMLDKNEWQKFTNSFSLKSFQEKYILFYLITHSFNPTPYIYELLKKMQTKTGFRVLSFSKIPKEYEVDYVHCSDADLGGFVSLFENASYVVTSSFHGTAFAINFGIPLCSVVKELNGEDDRQASLLNKLGLENCIVPVGEKYELIEPSYCVEKQQQKLNELREESLDFLRKNISF